VLGWQPAERLPSHTAARADVLVRVKLLLIAGPSETLRLLAARSTRVLAFQTPLADCRGR